MTRPSAPASRRAQITEDYIATWVQTSVPRPGDGGFPAMRIASQKIN